MRKIVFLSILISTFACSSGGEDRVKEPKVATLVFPNANSECTEGTNKTPTESTIKFEWSPGEGSEDFRLIVKNLDSGVSTTYSTSKSFYELKLARGIAYSWYVISSNPRFPTKATSETWKFYNAAEGSSSYAPFPAEAVSPKMNESVKENSIILDWTATDIDNDIASYEVYLGTTNPPLLFKANVVESVLNTVPVESGKKYYWKVLTKDLTGNVSVSDVYSFNVN